MCRLPIETVSQTGKFQSLPEWVIIVLDQVLCVLVANGNIFSPRVTSSVNKDHHLTVMELRLQAYQETPVRSNVTTPVFTILTF